MNEVWLPLKDFEKMEAEVMDRRGPILEMLIPLANEGYENFIDGTTVYVRSL